MSEKTGFPRGRPKKGEVRPLPPSRKGQFKYTEDELELKCNEYFSKCEIEKWKPTFPGLAVFLGICSETLRVWYINDENKYTAISGVIKRAVDRMSDQIQQRSDSMAIFQLKQKCYGGYTDKPEGDTSGKLQIEILFGNEKSGN